MVVMERRVAVVVTVVLLVHLGIHYTANPLP